MPAADEQNEVATLLNGVMRHRWGRSTMEALAAGPLRHKDLLTAVSKPQRGPVHSKTFHSALHHLVGAGLVIRQPIGKRRTLYALTGNGYTALEILHAMDKLLDGHRTGGTTD